MLNSHVICFGQSASPHSSQWQNKVHTCRWIFASSLFMFLWFLFLLGLFLILDLWSLFPVSCSFCIRFSCVLSVCPVLVFSALVCWSFYFFLWLLPLYYSTLMSLSFGLLYVKCNSDFSALTLVCVLANSNSSLYLTFWYSDPCLYFDSDSCLALNKSLFHFTPVCILFTFITIRWPCDYVLAIKIFFFTYLNLYLSENLFWVKVS